MIALGRNQLFLLERVEAGIRHDGLFTLRSEKHHLEKPRSGTFDYKRVGRPIALTPDNRVDYYPSEDLYSLEVIDDNTFVMSFRYHQANALGKRDMQFPQAIFVDDIGNQYHADQISSLITPEQFELLEPPPASVRGVTFREREDTLFLADNVLLIRTHWFTNGFYSGSETTQLKRKR